MIDPSRLSEAARAALCSTPTDDSREIKANGNVLRGLERKGLCRDIVSYRDGSFARLTDEGLAAAAILLCE